MRRAAVIVWVLGLFAAGGLWAQKQPVRVAIDQEKAGPDFAVQGEYLGGGAEAGKLGAEVIARGDGKFVVNFLPGGLRGEGGDYAKRAEASGKVEDGKGTFASKDGKWTAAYAEGRLTGKTADGQSFALERLVRRSKTLGEKPPSGAVVLYAGPDDAAGWKKAKVVDGHLVGNETTSNKTFKDHKIHLEFRLSYMPFASGQGRSNSGVYVQGRHEVQVLDSFGLKGANNECGGLYGRAAPRVNMCYPPLQWQTYDIEFRTARPGKDGDKGSPATISVWHNGVLIHDRVELKDGKADAGPLHLQSHGGQVQYRNIWVVETDKSS